MSGNENDSRDGGRLLRKRVSLVWQYFEKLSSTKVKCRICRHEQRYMGNTANALRHLKCKHDVDARAVGLSDPENVKRLKELSVSSSVELERTITAVKKERTQIYSNEEDLNEITRRKSRRQYMKIANYDEEIDPYNTDSEPLVNFIDTNKYDEDDKNDAKMPLRYHHQKSSHTFITNPILISLEEKRLVAETEYYREKAEYFRIQKHLVALEARKLKFELEKLYEKS